MADYNESKLTKLSALKALAEKIKNDYVDKTEFDKLSQKVKGIVETGGEANKLEGVKINGVALDIADKMVDLLIAEGTDNGTIKVNNVDIAVKGLAELAYKAEVSETELEAALKSKIDAKAEGTAVAAIETKLTTLIGSDTSKSVRDIANEELAKQLIAEEADEALDTLQEIAAWIQKHPKDASEMNQKITALTTFVGTLPLEAESTTVVEYIAEAIKDIGIGDYAKTADVTNQINTALGDYYKKTETYSKTEVYSKTEINDMIATDEDVQGMLDEVFAAAG